MQEELAQILELPFEQELHMIYIMIAARMQSAEGNVREIEGQLNKVERNLENASNDVLYLYHRNKGTFEYANDIHTCLSHYLQALDYNDNKLRPDITLLYAIGTCYSHINRPIIAMRYLERAKNEYKGDLSNMVLNAIDNALADCYIFLGEPEKALTLLTTSLMQARSYGNDLTTIMTLLTLGHVNYKLKNYKESIENNDEVFTLSYHKLEWPKPQGALNNCVWALVRKAKCLIALTTFAGCTDVLNKAREVAKDDQKSIIEIETARHMMTPNDSASLNYLETVSLPYYRNYDAMGVEFIIDTLELCDTLETVYRKRRAAKKADAIVNIIRGIYKEIIYGPSGD